MAGVFWLVREAAVREGTSPDAGDRTFGEEDAARQAHLEGRAEDAPGTSATADTDPEPTTAALVIHAVLSGPGTELAGVRVAIVDGQARRHEGLTDAAGRFEVTGAARGFARVEGSAPGFLVEATEVAVGAEPAEIRLYFLRAASARGRVLSADTDRPVAGARVIAAPHATAGAETPAQPGDAWCVVLSDAEGRFTLDAVPGDESFGLAVVARGYARELTDVELHGASEDSQEIVIRLEAGATLGGVVEDRRGRAVAGAEVYVFSDGDEVLSVDPRGGWSDGVRYVIALLGRADGEGRFEVLGLAPDARYAATAFAPDYPRAEDVTGITVTAGRSAPDVCLVLPDPATIEVTVRDEEGGLLPGARIASGSTELGFFMAEPERETDANGRLVLLGLGAGEHVVSAEAPGFLVEERNVELLEGRREQLSFRLRRAAAISGIVVNLDGRPLEGIRVCARPEEGLSFVASTDEEGRFLVERIAPGSVRIEAGGDGRVLPQALTVRAPASDVRIECVGPTCVRGRLVLPPGSPPPENIQVGLYETSGAGVGSVEPWRGGRFELLLGPEPRILRIQGKSFAIYEHPVHVEVGVTLDLGDVQLSPGVVCRGTVVDASGTPIPGAWVIAVGQEWQNVETDEQGRFELEHVRARDLSIDVEARGYLSCWLPILPGGVGLDQRIVLTRGGLLRLRVLDADGLAVVAAFVRIVPADLSKEEDADAYSRRSAWEETDEQGRLEIRMAPGAYRIEADVDDEILAVGEATLTEGETTEITLRP